MKIQIELMTGDKDEIVLVPYWKILLDYEFYHESISYKDMIKRMMKEFLDKRYGVQDKNETKFKKVKATKDEKFLSQCKKITLYFKKSEFPILQCFEKYCKEESLTKNIGLKTIMKSYIYSRLGDGRGREGSGIPPMWKWMIIR